MRSLISTIVASAAITLLSVGATSAAITLNFGGTVSTENTGASGRAVLSFADEVDDVRLSVQVTNTTGSPLFGLGATSSKLTAFAFNLVSGASLIANTFQAGVYLDTLILNAKAPPFAPLDIAAADNTNYVGGNANGALPQGVTDYFSLRLATILDAAGLESAFRAALTSSPALATAMRFQQVKGGLNKDGSDKLSNPTVGMSPVPVPPAVLSLLLGFGGLGAIRTLRNRFASPAPVQA